MKTRSDFVTNSSSSSFIIATKGNLTEAEFMDRFGVPKEEYGCTQEEIEQYWGKILDLLDKGFIVSEGDAWSDGGEIEAMICNAPHRIIEKDDLYIEFGGGY